MFGVHHEGIVAPVAEGSEPKIPIEAWLVGSVDARAFAQVLWLIAEGISNPIDAVVGTLKFDFVTSPRHAAEEAILIGDTEGLEQSDGFYGKTQTGNNFRNKRERHRAKNPQENRSNQPQAQS